MRPLRWCIALADSAVDGEYLVRRGKDGSYILLFMYKSKKTHHMIKKGDDGLLMINNLKCENCATVKQVFIVKAISMQRKRHGGGACVC